MTQIILNQEDVRNLISDTKFDVTGTPVDNNKMSMSLTGNQGTSLKLTMGHKQFVDLLFGQEGPVVSSRRKRASHKKETPPTTENKEEDTSRQKELSVAPKTPAAPDAPGLSRTATPSEKAMLAEYEKYYFGEGKTGKTKKQELEEFKEEIKTDPAGAKKTLELQKKAFKYFQSTK